MKNALLGFETYTASLAGGGDVFENVIGKADTAFAAFDDVLTKVDNVVPGLAYGSADELLQKVKTLRELADSFNKRSAVFMEEGRRSLLDISQGAIKVTRKFDPQAGTGDTPAPPRKPGQRRP